VGEGVVLGRVGDILVVGVRKFGEWDGGGEERRRLDVERMRVGS
jgi:hypothetical protein